MADWASIEAGLESWFETVTGLRLEWRNDRGAGKMSPKPRAFAQIISVVQEGGNELIYDFDGGQPAAEEMVPTVFGKRLVTVSFMVHNRSQKPTEDARFYLEKARNATRLPSAQQILTDAGIALVSNGPLTILDSVFDKRWESRASFDIIVRVLDCVTYTDEGISYIDKAVVSSDIDGVPDELEFDDEEFGNV